MTDGDVPDGDESDATADEPAPERSNGPDDETDHSAATTDENGDERRAETDSAETFDDDGSSESSTVDPRDDGDGPGDGSDTSGDGSEDADQETGDQDRADGSEAGDEDSADWNEAAAQAAADAGPEDGDESTDESGEVSSGRDEADADEGTTDEADTGDSDVSDDEDGEDDVTEPSEELAKELIDEDSVTDMETMEPDPVDGTITSEDEFRTVEWDPEDEDENLDPAAHGDAGLPSEAGAGADSDDPADTDDTDGRPHGPREGQRGGQEAGQPPSRRRDPAELAGDDDGPTAAGVADGDAYRGDTPADEIDPDHAPDDQEMPLAVHVEEMVKRLGVIIVLMAGVSAVVFPFGEQIINTIWYAFLPGSFELCPTTSAVPWQPATIVTGVMGDVGAGPGVAMADAATIKPACPRVYAPLAVIFARLKVSTLAGFVIALPAFVYETYLFMRPGLFPRERRYYLAAVPTSLVLAAVGVAFAYLLVLPAIFTYFLYYSEGAVDIAFGLTQTFDLMVLMMGFFAAIFQIPLFMMLAIMMGVTSRQWLADRRLLFWAAFAGIAFIFNPDPTGMAPFIVAATMIVLFEGTLLLLSWTGSEGLLPSPRAVAARRPYAWVLAGLTGYLASSATLPDGYYEALPALVRGFIESNDLLGVTPLVVGGAIIAGYELAMFLLRRYLPIGKWRRRLFTGRVSLFRLRSPVWLLSLVIGYLTSPNPFLLDRAADVALEPTTAAALTVGLIVVFEVLLAVWRYLRPDEAERLPIEQ
ncbi:twin-arginine translocase subunit TatC [Halorhabdus salina]|uniref:twin-arginine translocase subunit TatC n=1 Tax=Halorhabdus salina TaxID=2750670 RepID=UPI0015EF622F|nr:twin-arginine translocase subunit TatC [Halorhabdus salina]